MNSEKEIVKSEEVRKQLAWIKVDTLRRARQSLASEEVIVNSEEVYKKIIT